MQLSQRQRAVLDEIGIPLWGLRSSTDTEAKPVEITEQATTLIDHELDLSAHVWLAMASVQMSDAEQRLLNSMMKAIGLSRESVAILEQQKLESLAETAYAGKRIFLFGTTDKADLDQAKPEIVRQENDSCWVVTYSLSKLMQEPALKAAAWRALKLLKTTY